MLILIRNRPEGLTRDTYNKFHDKQERSRKKRRIFSPRVESRTSLHIMKRKGNETEIRILAVSFRKRGHETIISR
jgi:hypothetical protein